MKTQKADLEERERRLAQCSSLFTGRDAIVSCSQTCIKMLLFIKHIPSQYSNLVVGGCLVFMIRFIITKSSSRTSLGCLRAMAVVASEFRNSGPAPSAHLWGHILGTGEWELCRLKAG